MIEHIDAWARWLPELWMLTGTSGHRHTVSENFTVGTEVFSFDRWTPYTQNGPKWAVRDTEDKSLA